jgi:hypothetical protein
MTSESRDLWKDHNSLSQPGCLSIRDPTFGTSRGTSADRSAKTGLRMALLGGAGEGLSLSVFD